MYLAMKVKTGAQGGRKVGAACWVQGHIAVAVIIAKVASQSCHSLPSTMLPEHKQKEKSRTDKSRVAPRMRSSKTAIAETRLSSGFSAHPLGHIGPSVSLPKPCETPMRHIDMEHIQEKAGDDTSYVIALMAAY
jgi:hypothetical protein